MGQSMLDTANGTLSSINSMLQRMRDLSEQAANGTYGKEEREAMQAEVDALSAEIKRIKNTTEFNGKKLFETENEIETATQINTNANKPVTLSAISNNGIATYANNDDVIDMSAISDDDWDSTAGKVIKLNTADDLKKLATITNGGKDTSGRTFALGADIDMQGVNFVPIGRDNRISFEGVFDGQGFTISNLTINSNDSFVGFFGDTNRATIKNVILDNVKIIANNSGGICGGLIGKSGRTTVDSCFVTGSIENAGYSTGGLIAYTLFSTTVTNCSTNTIVECTNTAKMVTYTGAFIGYNSSSSISECTASGSISADINTSRGYRYIAGFVGRNEGDIVNCSSSANVSLLGTPDSNTYVGGFVGNNYNTIKDCKYTGKMDNNCSGDGKLGAIAGFGRSSGTLENNEYKYDTTFDLATGATGTTSITGTSEGDVTGTAHNSNTTDYPAPKKPAKKDKYSDDPTPTPTPSSKSTTDYCRFNLQVGIDSTENSVIEIDTGFKLGDFTISLLDSEDGTIKGDENARKALDTIDALMARVTNKMTDIASTQNRIESVIEFQEIQRNALTSANSLIKDADIALESANYLKNQILQNVTSALLSTANQSPQIALQLI